MLPNFLLVGANKGGSTSMNRYLQSHPEIFMSSMKEPQYFHYMDSEPPENPIWRVVTTREAYEALFDAVQGEKVVGEASTVYLCSKLAPGRVHEAIPHAKVLAILRDPSDRAFSAHAMWVRRGLDPEHNFEAAIDRQLEVG